jgi:hypothetical protein
MHNITGRITVVLTAACLLALLVVTVSAGFSGTLLGPGQGSSQSLTIASLTGDNQWSSASLISQISSDGFGARTRSVLENWVPPVNQVYTTPTRQMPSFMNSDGNPSYDWDALFAKPKPYCGCGGCS